MRDIDPRAVLLVSGSPRKNGNTDLLLRTMEEALRGEGFTTTFAGLRDYAIHSCIGCERCRTDGTCTEFYDGMHLLYPRIEEAAGLVVGSPTYNYNITPEMKCFIDRLYPYFDFTDPRPGPYTARLAEGNRKMVTVGVCEQHEETEMGYTMPAMSEALRAVGYDVVAELPITGHFRRAAVRGDEYALEHSREVAGRLAQALKERA